MSFATLDAEGRQLSIALLDEAVGPTVSPIPLLDPVMVAGTAKTIARVATLLADAKPLEKHHPDLPPPQRMYGTQFIVSPSAEEDQIDFHTFHLVNQAGHPRTDPVLRLKNFSVSGTAKAGAKKAAKKLGPTAEQNHRPPRHRPSPMPHQKAPQGGGAVPVDLGPQGRATTSDVTPTLQSAPLAGSSKPAAAKATRAAASTTKAATASRSTGPKASAKGSAKSAVARAAAPQKAGTEPATKAAAKKGSAPRSSKR